MTPRRFPWGPTVTADQLDPEAEARIREACPRHRLYPTEHEYFSVYLPSCYCEVQRAAILTDREARPAASEVLALRCRKHYATLPIVNMPDGKECAICLRDDERAHADALASMIGVLLDELDAYRDRERACPCCDGHAPPYEDAETYHADDCSWVKADKLLAEHHRRRS